LDDLKKTPLNAAHRDAGAKMVAFGGWEMPVEYAGLISEHNAVRSAAGLFDVSHMGQVTVEGAGALAFLQRVTCNDVARLEDGRGQYSALPDPGGCPVDDVVLFRRAQDRYLIIVNAANIEKDVAWLEQQGPEGCRVTNRSDDYALLALQGPRAQEILQRLTPLDLPGIGFYRFAEGEVDGRPVSVSRNGYTGEDGFELLVPTEHATGLWTRLLEAGEKSGLVPVGLGARDTLRLEARLLLYGNDIDSTTTLVEAGLGWTVSLAEHKGDFVGRGVLEEQKKAGAPRRLVGFEVTGRGIARHGYPVLLDGVGCGGVTSGSFAPHLQKNIGLCYLPKERAAEGTPLEIEVRGRRVPASVVPTPFYKRPQ
jgi:aminomethyltransferase